MPTQSTDSTPTWSLAEPTRESRRPLVVLAALIVGGLLILVILGPHHATPVSGTPSADSAHLADGTLALSPWNGEPRLADRAMALACKPIDDCSYTYLDSVPETHNGRDSIRAAYRTTLGTGASRITDVWVTRDGTELIEAKLRYG